MDTPNFTALDNSTIPALQGQLSIYQGNGSDAYYDTEFLRLKDLANDVTLYLLPVIICFGFLGNVFSLLVLLRTYMRRLSVSVYLASLAGADTIFLLTLLVVWFDHYGWRAFNRNGVCQTTIFLSYASSFLSVWSVVGFSVERFIAICLPLQRPALCTPHRAKVVSAALAVTALIIYLPVNWTVAIYHVEGKTLCLPQPSRATLNTSVIYLDTVIAFLLPVLAVIVINITVSTRIVQFMRMKHSLRPSQQIYSNNRKMRKQITMTRSILLISSAYLAINLPSYVMRIKVIVDNFFNPDYEFSNRDFLLQRFFQFLYYINFSINFLLYSVCSTKFREAVKRPLRQFIKNTQKVLHYYEFLRRQSQAVEKINDESFKEPMIGPTPMERSEVVSETRHMKIVPKTTSVRRRCHSI